MTNEPARRAGVLAVLVTASLLCTTSCSAPGAPEPAAQDTARRDTSPPDASLDGVTSGEEDSASASTGEEQLLEEAPDAASVQEAREHAQAALAASGLEPFRVTLPGTTTEIEMLPVPGGTCLTGRGPVEIAPFYMASTETTWDAYDVLVYRKDLADERHADEDGVSRPTKPYISVDRGFGHAGFPALSMSPRGAEVFCEWLSQVTGRTFRLPTTTEFEWAARAMSPTPYGCGEVAGLGEHAWFRDNAGRKTHPVGTRSPNAWGLLDLHGNTAEWALDEDGHPVVCGGSFRDTAEKLCADARRQPSAAWNASDPQVPKSVWWLADANFVGFRVVCDPR